MKSLLPAATLQKIKGNGILQAYVLAHEGVTNPRSIGEGKVKMTWPKRVIEKLSSVVQAGTKFFKGHGSTNSHEGRSSVGEVVKSFLRSIDGKVSNIVIGHFPSKEDVKDLDIVSIEASVETDTENNVQDIKGITGVAMESSDNESPAFPGAKRLAMIQCFSVATVEPLEKGEKIMTFEEIKKGVKDLNIFPHQLFNENDMKADNTFGKMFDQLSTLEVDNQRLKDEKNTIEKSSKDSLRKVQVIEAKETFEELTKEGFTDKQKKYIKKNFTPEKIDDLSEAGIKSFIDSEKKSYSEVAKIFGAEENDNNNKNNNNNTDNPDADPVAELLKESGV